MLTCSIQGYTQGYNSGLQSVLTCSIQGYTRISVDNPPPLNTLSKCDLFSFYRVLQFLCNMRFVFYYGKKYIESLPEIFSSSIAILCRRRAGTYKTENFPSLFEKWSTLKLRRQPSRMFLVDCLFGGNPPKFFIFVEITSRWPGKKVQKKCCRIACK